MSFLSQIRFCFIPVALSTYPTKIDLMKSKKNPQDVISVQPQSYFGTNLFGTTMSHWYKNVFCGHTILDYRKIDKFKLSIRKVPKTSDYRFLADYSDNQLAKSLKRFEIRWVT